MDELTIGMVDDHPALLSGLITDLRPRFPGVELIPASSTSELLDLTHDLSLVLLDVHLADENLPKDNVSALTLRGWPVLLYTQERRQLVLGPCFLAGAVGVVDKSSTIEELCNAIEAVTQQGSYITRELALSLREMETWPNVQLTPREIECIRLYASGLPLKSVALRLGIAQTTVQQHLRNIKEKYTIQNRPAYTKVALYQRALEDGLVLPPIPPPHWHVP